MERISEVRTLSLHPKAIHTFIKAQAGSLAKAFSEGVMNSIDAFATQVHITLDSKGYTIEDNGQGFRNKEEIAAWFETMGFPHDEGNHRTYGKFGMGRAQQWAFARTVWTSNQYVMRVDVQDKGLDYELEIADQPFNGTRIEGEFYDEMPFAQLQHTEIELQNLVKYVPATVMLNGKLVSKDPTTEKWDLETPEAYFRFSVDKKQHRTLDVYNAGLLVAHFQEYRFQCVGVVVTKPTAPLSLNLARNEILEKECKVWAKVVKSLPRKEKPASTPKPEKMSETSMRDLARQVVAGAMTLERALEKSPHLVVSVLGRPVPLKDLSYSWRMRPVVFVAKGDEFGKRLNKLKLATVINAEALDTFGVDVAKFKALVRVHAVHSHTYNAAERLKEFDDNPWTDDAPSAFPQLAAGKKQFTLGEMKDAEKAASLAWNRARIALTNDLRGLVKENDAAQARLQEVNYLTLGDCPLGEIAWVDVAAGTWVLNRDRTAAAMSRPLPVVTKFALACFRPLCDYVAGSADGGKELLLQLLSETEALGVFILNLTRFYINECKKHEVPVQRTRLEDLDALNTM